MLERAELIAGSVKIAVIQLVSRAKPAKEPVPGSQQHSSIMECLRKWQHVLRLVMADDPLEPKARQTLPEGRRLSKLLNSPPAQP